MSAHDPFTGRNRTHRDHIAPFSPRYGHPHPVREQWRGRQRPRAPIAGPGEPLLLRAGRAIGRHPRIFITIALAAGTIFAARILYAAIAWHWA